MTGWTPEALFIARRPQVSSELWGVRRSTLSNYAPVVAGRTEVQVLDR